MRKSTYITIALFLVCIPLPAVQPRSIFKMDRIKAEKTAIRNDTKYDCKIPVTDQVEFDRIWDDVSKALDCGAKTILVCINKGNYSFNENHIPIINRHYPEASLRIEGNGAEIISAKSRNKQYCQPDATSFSAEMSPISAWSEWKQCSSPIEVVDEKNKICRVPAGGLKFSEGMMIQVSQWYETVICPVTKIVKGLLYFKDNDLSYNEGRKCWSVNEDIRFGKSMPHYRIFKPRTSAHYVCKNANFLSIYGSEFKSIHISGLNFNGNRSENALIMIEKFKGSSFVISNCTFTNLASDAIYILSSDKVSICDNTFSNCAQNAIWSDNLSNGTFISDNLFERMGQKIQYGGIVNCQGDHFAVSANEFIDFPYAAIQAGNHYASTPANACTGIIEKNTISYSKDYLGSKNDCTLMDSGAIYLFTRCDDIIIRDNTIKNYTGKAGNRGIFCDDGAKNISIYRNTIEVLDGNDAICLWYPEHVGEYVNDFCENNVVMNNTFINCKYTFEQKPGSNSINKGNKIVVK